MYNTEIQKELDISQRLLKSIGINCPDDDILNISLRDMRYCNYPYAFIVFGVHSMVHSIVCNHIQTLDFTQKGLSNMACSLTLSRYFWEQKAIEQECNYILQDEPFYETCNIWRCLKALKNLGLMKWQLPHYAQIKISLLLALMYYLQQNTPAIVDEFNSIIDAVLREEENLEKIIYDKMEQVKNEQ